MNSNVYSNNNNWSTTELLRILQYTVYSYDGVDSGIDCYNNGHLKYKKFHKTLPKSSLQMHWISVRFYEIGDINSTLCTVMMRLIVVPTVLY